SCRRSEPCQPSKRRLDQSVLASCNSCKRCSAAARCPSSPVLERGHNAPASPAEWTRAAAPRARNPFSGRWNRDPVVRTGFARYLSLTPRMDDFPTKDIQIRNFLLARQIGLNSQKTAPPERGAGPSILFFY